MFPTGHVKRTSRDIPDEDAEKFALLANRNEGDGEGGGGAKNGDSIELLDGSIKNGKLLFNDNQLIRLIR